MSEDTITQPELLKLLSGEISFDAWLEKQDGDQSKQVSTKSTNLAEEHSANPLNLHTFDGHETEDSSIFSSWGNAFTSKSYTEPCTSESIPVLESEQLDETPTEESDVYDEEDEDNFYQPEDSNTDKKAVTSSSNTASTKDIFKLPSFESVPPFDENDNVIQGFALVPVIEKLCELVKTSTVRSKFEREKKKPSKNQFEEIPDIMKDFQAFQLRKRSSNFTRNKLPELLRMQMGQANLLVAKGDFKQAADICMEIVREAPYSGQPFKTLSFIYDEQGDKEMSLQYSLIAAFLDCKDPQEWRELAKKCTDSGNMKQTLACYDRACKVQPADLGLQWERASLYFEAMDYRKCLDIYQTLIKIINPTDHLVYLELAKSIAKLYHKHGMSERAGETLDAALAICPGFQDIEAVHMLSDILVSGKKYKKCIKLFANHTKIQLPTRIIKPTKKDTKLISELEKANFKNINQYLNKTGNENFDKSTSELCTSITDAVLKENYSDSMTLIDKVCSSTTKQSKQYATLQNVSKANKKTDQKKSIENNKNDFVIPDNLPLDLRVKLAQSLINTKEYEVIATLVQPLFNENMESVGDLVLDIAEAYFDTGNYEEALKYLSELAVCEKYNQAAVWLRIAECHDHLDHIEDSITAYYQVLGLAPLQVAVRFTLSTALRKVGREDEAMSVLAEYENACIDDDGEEQLNISDKNRLQVEEYAGWYEKCIQMYKDGLFRDFLYHSYILMHNYLMSSFNYQKKQTIGKPLMWDLLLKILKVSVTMKENKRAISIIEKAMIFKPYGESKKYRLDLDYLLTTVCFISGEYSKAFDSFRLLLMHESEAVIEKNALWDLFTNIVNKMLDKRHHRFTLRLIFKRPKLIPLIIQNGNNSHLSGTYKYAIGEFSRAFREWPTYPLNSLLLGVSFLHLSCQKFHTTRHTSILHGLIFMFQYFKLREENQEAYYNLGRAFHQIGLVHFAVHYYNKALQFPLHNEKNKDMINATYHPYIDLHREVAYNLSLIYRASGNIELAKDILYRYCWV